MFLGHLVHSTQVNFLPTLSLYKPAGQIEIQSLLKIHEGDEHLSHKALSLLHQVLAGQVLHVSQLNMSPAGLLYKATEFNSNEKSFIPQLSSAAP